MRSAIVAGVSTVNVASMPEFQQGRREVVAAVSTVTSPGMSQLKSGLGCGQPVVVAPRNAADKPAPRRLSRRAPPTERPARRPEGRRPSGTERASRNRGRGSSDRTPHRAGRGRGAHARPRGPLETDEARRHLEYGRIPPRRWISAGVGGLLSSRSHSSSSLLHVGTEMRTSQKRPMCVERESFGTS